MVICFNEKQLLKLLFASSFQLFRRPCAPTLAPLRLRFAANSNRVIKGIYIISFRQAKLLVVTGQVQIVGSVATEAYFGGLLLKCLCLLFLFVCLVSKQNENNRIF